MQLRVEGHRGPPAPSVAGIAPSISAQQSERTGCGAPAREKDRSIVSWARRHALACLSAALSGNGHTQHAHHGRWRAATSPILAPSQTAPPEIFCLGASLLAIHGCGQAWAAGRCTRTGCGHDIEAANCDGTVPEQYDCVALRHALHVRGHAHTDAAIILGVFVLAHNLIATQLVAWESYLHAENFLVASHDISTVVAVEVFPPRIAHFCSSHKSHES